MYLMHQKADIYVFKSQQSRVTFFFYSIWPWEKYVLPISNKIAIAKQKHKQMGDFLLIRHVY